jgi:hypothetical protein
MEDRMNGFDEAAEWLRANAPDWRITSGRAFATAWTVGTPTEEHVEVALALVGVPHQQVELRGEGSSYVEAVRRAIGALNSA